jgi:signal transduction histidine kinase
LAGQPREALENTCATEHASKWGIYHSDGKTLARPEELPLSRAVLQGEITSDEEWVIKRPTGESLSILCNAAPIRDADGHITGGLIAWRDVSARKHLEEKLRERAKLESLGILAGGIAHDFNNLLTGILGNASLLLDELSEGVFSRTYAQAISDAAERAAKLTHQMLAYSGRGRFVVEPVNLSAYIRQTTALIDASIPKNVELRLDLSDDLPSIEADTGQLQQVLMNLVINAAEAIGPSGGRVTVGSSVQAIDNTYIQTLKTADNIKPGRYVVVEVSDNGCGMDEQTLARMFDPFFTTKFAGRGLGLAAVQGIVRGHKGAIKIYSTPGQGTIARVLFPVAAARASEGQSAAPASTGRGAGTVLVIDDEEVIRSTANSALRRLGYRVLTASDGAQGVEVYRILQNRISLVLLDMTMPGISGEETLNQLRKINPAVPIVLSSGFSEAEALSRFGNQSLAGFLQKPYTMQKLGELVKSATT